MNRGLILRAFRESWPTTLMLGVVLAAVEALLAFVLPKFGAQFSQQWLQIGFARSFIQSMLGVEIGDRLGPQMFHAIAWAHPLVLAVTLAHAMLAGTRVPAGEVDRGTADVMFGLPVSRWEIFLSETFVWLCGGLILFAAALAGNLFGSLGLPALQRPEMPRVLRVWANLFCLYAAVGGLTWLVSSFSDRRGRAITTVFVIVLVLVLLDYLAPFWPPLQKFVFLSPLHYHRPALVLQQEHWPVRDMSVLAATAVALWFTGGVVFARRDLCTT